VFGGVANAARAVSIPCGVVETIDELLACERAAESRPGTTAPSSPRDPRDPRDPREPWTRGFTDPVYDPTRLLVRFVRGTPRATVARVVRSAGGRLERRIPALGIDVVKSDPAQLARVAVALARSRAVARVERELVVAASAIEPNDAHWSAQTGLRVAKFTEAWASTRGSTGVVIAVVDTGVWPAHPDLAGSVLPGYDAVNNDADANDDHGHGTAVAGVIAARTNNGEGIAGVCWVCRILPVKALGSDGYGTTNAVAAGIVWAADRGADVINLSLGAPSTTEALTSAVRYANAKGALVVAAAGNAGLSSPFYPAAEVGVLGVAATDDDDRTYSWSNHGGWVPVAAPGCLPVTAVGGGYGAECGTSIAAPVVAGLAALVLARNPALPPTAVAEVVRRGAAPIGPAVTYGRIDAARTLALVPPQVVLRSLVARGALSRARAARVYTVRTSGGAVTAVVTRRGSATVTVEIVDARGRTLARARGRSTVRVSHRVGAGVYRVRVRGAAGAFAISVTYPAAVDAATEPEQPR